MANQKGRAPVFIVPVNELLLEQQIREERVTFQDLCFQTTLECIQWMARRRLLRNIFTCLNCNSPMSFVKRQQMGDGYRWQCRICLNAASVRNNSFFSRSRLSLQQLVTIIYGWSQDYTQEAIAREAEVKSPQTIVDWCSFCRDVCEQYFINNPVAIGGLNEDLTAKVVEIGKSKYFHKKYHRGQRNQDHWVFGGIERESGNCFLIEVSDQNEQTFSALIQRFILPGSIIISDGYGAYNRINELGGRMYEHKVIVRQENFVDPQDRCVHIQNLENMWMRSKYKLRRQFGTSETLFQSYLHEFMWRNKFKRLDLFAEFVICITQQYPI